MADAITTHSSQKVTLSERYTVSTLPQELLTLVDALQNDATRLQQSQSPVRKAHKDLTKVIHLIMLLHRGLVPHLTKLGFPRMLLYNDFSYLATMLVRKDDYLQDTANSLKRSAESFYKIEIEEKQQQIHLILDSANGFVACTTPTQQLTCTAALQECIDLLSRLQERWESTLSRATLLTALGNLVETAVARFTYEVMSMTDIAEQESAELAKLGDLLSTVERKLFQQAEGGQALAAPYVPSWFRFRYCLEILEANLAYILDLYRDGSLVDFEKRELVEMIQALFADSDKRRMAIAEIQGAKRWQ
jgi:centromere/kinetochore protein ZW10